ncbi:MAG: helix-turn-helix domain-containing protein [Planctomycetes bacterium]|nr:helix-turn-helix domain-containing protein [Planctomycetota bacterium]
MRQTALNQDAIEIDRQLAEAGWSVVLTSDQAAEILGLSRGRTLCALRERRLKGHRLGGTGAWRVHRLDVARFIVGLTPS